MSASKQWFGNPSKNKKAIFNRPDPAYRHLCLKTENKKGGKEGRKQGGNDTRKQGGKERREQGGRK